MTKPELQPQLPGASLIYQPRSLVQRLELTQLFSLSQPLEVELGSGDGSFLAQWAGQHPERNFLGVERLMGRLRKLDRKGRRSGLTNLRVLRIEAGYFVEYLLPPHSVAALHIYFPDPWPKRRHWKNRLINPHFADVVAQALESRGHIYLRTDDPAYFAQMQETFAGHRHFRLVDTPLPLAAVVTDFERDFNARGVSTLRLACERT